MKIILSAIITIVLLVGLFIRPLRKHRWKILAGYAVAVAALFTFYNYRTLDLILPFYRPVNQMFYQEEFMESGEYVDAIIPYLTKDKTIYFPQYLNFDIAEEIKESNELWSSGSSLGMDLKNILTENGANVILADTGYGYDSTNRDMAEFVSENFDDMGYINDTLRYAHLYNDIKGEYGNGFYYYWAYSKSFSARKLYACPKQLEESNELYLILDTENNAYLVSKSFLEEEVAKY